MTAAIRVLIAVNWLLVAAGCNGLFAVGFAHRRACDLQASYDVDPKGDASGLPDSPLSEQIHVRNAEYRERFADAERVGKIGWGVLALFGIGNSVALMVLFPRMARQVGNNRDEH